MSGLLYEKICLVTGAGRGIGKAIALRFAEEGAVVYATDREEGSVEQWSANLTPAMHRNIHSIYFDMTDRSALKQAVLRVKKECGKIDVLVNNAGIAYNEKIGMIAYDRLSKMFEVNVFAVLEMLQLVARVMMRQKSGSIINISSIVGVEGDKGQTAYSATKGAVISMTKSAAKELAPNNIRVNSVAPGLTDTEMFKETDPKYLEERLVNIGMNRLAKPEDIANACVFLASDQAEYISGQVLGVNGCSVL